VKVVKNKVAPPFKQAEFDIMYAEGISHVSLLVDIGSESGIIEKSGAWYSYKGQRIGQGRENAKMFLKDNPKMMAEVEEGVKGVLGMTATVAAEGEACRGVHRSIVVWARIPTSLARWPPGTFSPHA
jgi:recombination protein RecA